MGACRKQLEEQERAALLSWRSGAPDWQSEVGSGVVWCSCMVAHVNSLPHRHLQCVSAPGEATHGRVSMVTVAMQMAAEAAVRGSVGTSRRVLDEAYETGTAILGSMASQRDTLKVQRIAHDAWLWT